MGRKRTMNLYISFISVASILIAAVAYPYVSQLIKHTVSKGLGREDHCLAVPPGDGILKILVFLFLWIAVSFLLAIPLFLCKPPASSP